MLVIPIRSSCWKMNGRHLGTSMVVFTVLEKDGFWKYCFMLGFWIPRLRHILVLNCSAVIWDELCVASYWTAPSRASHSFPIMQLLWKKLPSKSSSILKNRNNRSMTLPHGFYSVCWGITVSWFVCIIKVWKLIYSSGLLRFCPSGASSLSLAHVPLVPNPWSFWGIWWFIWFNFWILLLPDMFILVSPQHYCIDLLVLLILQSVGFCLDATLRKPFFKTEWCLFIIRSREITEKGVRPISLTRQIQHNMFSYQLCPKNRTLSFESQAVEDLLQQEDGTRHIW